MKKLVSILLLVLLVYNMAGYYVFVAVQQADVQQELHRTKQHFSVEELLVFKVPVPLYHQNNRGLETAEGRFEHQGHFYEMVKQKLEDDTLYIYCYNDKKTQQLVADLSHHTRNHLTDAKGEAGKNENLLKTFIREYLPFSEITFAFLPFATEQKFTVCAIPVLPSATPDIASPPPRQA